MGGTIDVESEVGVGTTFVVQLSAPEAEAEEPAAALPGDAEPASSRAEGVTPRVLVVEDNAVNQLVARRLLLSCTRVPALHFNRQGANFRF